MDGAGLIECLLNYIKPLHFTVASQTAKVQISLIISQNYLNCRYIEIIQTIKINEIIAYT